MYVCVAIPQDGQCPGGVHQPDQGLEAGDQQPQTVSRSIDQGPQTGDQQPQTVARSIDHDHDV